MIPVKILQCSLKNVSWWRLALIGSSFIGSMPWMLDSVFAAPLPGGSMNPTKIPKYITPLYIPPTMPLMTTKRVSANIDYYEISARQISQQVLPKPLPKTTVWAYGSASDPKSFHFPAATIEAKVNRPVRVKWINDLKNSKSGAFFPHLVPIDQTLHWANPPGGVGGQDSMGMDPKPYRGPVPLVTHVHGSHVVPEGDGYPESWTLPAATNIPKKYATRGTQWTQLAGVVDEPGAATYQYTNDQRATHLWFHDHALGMTRSNVYAGLAGNYMVRGGSSDLPSTLLPQKPYEIPLVIQDRSFNANGQLFYPGDRAFFEGVSHTNLQVPFIPAQTKNNTDSDISPLWNPEFFANVMLVNGHSWPELKVEQRRYRFRILNGSDSRFMVLKIANNPKIRPILAELPLWIMGSDGGFQPEPTQVGALLMAPAERYDVVVDFSDVPVGTALYLINEGPDEPYNGKHEDHIEYADPNTTGQIMKLTVIPRKSKDVSLPPQKIPTLLPKSNLGQPVKVRKVSVNELNSQTVFAHYENNVMKIFEDIVRGVPFGPAVSLLGTLNSPGFPMPLHWMAPVTENPGKGTTELWEIYNFTNDAHPIHMHLVEFQVINREPLMRDDDQEVLLPATLQGSFYVREPEVWENSAKDTVIAYPGEITRLKARFDRPGKYVWHCHILSHEDNDMMRPICVGKSTECTH